MKGSVRFLSNLAVAAASAAIGLVAIEAAFRFIDDYAITSPRLTASKPRTSPDDAGHPLVQKAYGYVKNMPVREDVDAAWFLERPDFPAPKPVLADLDRRSLAGQVDPVTLKHGRRIWNSHFIDRLTEMGGTAYQKSVELYSENLMEFSDAQDAYPTYRLVPNDPMPESMTVPNIGMVVNNLGYRGPDITIARRPDTIRIAFLGASTTIEGSRNRLGYPEYTVFYLNKWAAAKGLSVRFEAINAGREAFKSMDMVGVAQSELIHLKPDLVVYMEGANQWFASFPKLLELLPTSRDYVGATYAPTSTDELNKGIFRWSAVARRLVNFAPSYSTLPERAKPPYRLHFPATVDEMNPSLDARDLPLDLPQIVADLGRIKTAISPYGGELVVSTFVWLAYEGMELDAARHRSIYWYLNGSSMAWPMTYSDIRRLADFENRVFKAYGDTRGAGSIDLARYFPLDPDLLIDGIHKNPAGIRLGGWIAFQELLPIIEARLADRRLPKAIPANLPEPAYTDLWPYAVKDRKARPDQLDIKLPPLKDWRTSQQVTVAAQGNGVEINGPAQRSWYLLTSPVIEVEPKRWYRAPLRVDVLKGEANVKVLDADADKFVNVAVGESGALHFNSSSASRIRLIITNSFSSGRAPVPTVVRAEE